VIEYKYYTDYSPLNTCLARALYIARL